MLVFVEMAQAPPCVSAPPIGKCRPPRLHSLEGSGITIKECRCLVLFRWLSGNSISLRSGVQPTFIVSYGDVAIAVSCILSYTPPDTVFHVSQIQILVRTRLARRIMIQIQDPHRVSKIVSKIHVSWILPSTG